MKRLQFDTADRNSAASHKRDVRDAFKRRRRRAITIYAVYNLIKCPLALMLNKARRKQKKKKYKPLERMLKS